MKYKSTFVDWVTCLCSRGLTVYILRGSTIQRLIWAASVEFYIATEQFEKKLFFFQINNHAGCFLFSTLFYSVVAFHTQRVIFFSVYLSQKRSFKLNFFYKRKKKLVLNWIVTILFQKQNIKEPFLSQTSNTMLKPLLLLTFCIMNLPQGPCSRLVLLKAFHVSIPCCECPIH